MSRLTVSKLAWFGAPVVLSMFASASRKAPVKTREKEWTSEESWVAGAVGGRVLGGLYTKRFAALRRQSRSTAVGLDCRIPQPSCSANRDTREFVSRRPPVSAR